MGDQITVVVGDGSPPPEDTPTPVRSATAFLAVGLVIGLVAGLTLAPGGEQAAPTPTTVTTVPTPATTRLEQAPGSFLPGFTSVIAMLATAAPSRHAEYGAALDRILRPHADEAPGAALLEWRPDSIAPRSIEPVQELGPGARFNPSGTTAAGLQHVGEADVRTALRMGRVGPEWAARAVVDVNVTSFAWHEAAGASLAWLKDDGEATYLFQLPEGRERRQVGRYDDALWITDWGDWGFALVLRGDTTLFVDPQGAPITEVPGVARQVVSGPDGVVMLSIGGAADCAPDCSMPQAAILDLAGSSQPLPGIEQGEIAAQLVWSPDGTRYAMAISDGGEGAIAWRVFDVGGAALDEIAVETGSVAAAWSDDGGFLVIPVTEAGIIQEFAVYDAEQRLTVFSPLELDGIWQFHDLALR